MKKHLLLFLCLALGILIVSSMVTAQQYTYTGGEGIYNTPHDLRPGTPAGDIYGADDYLERVCVWCHAPHHTLKPGDAPDPQGGGVYVPLWNRGVSAQSFEVYSSGDGAPTGGPHALQAAAAGLNDGPGGVSRLCLSCHDGTIAVNVYGENPQDPRSISRGNRYISQQYLIGGLGDLTNHHPIGFNYYDVAAADDEIADPDAVMVDDTKGTGKQGQVLKIADLLHAGKMECSTCHDVHNSQNPGAEKFLWKSDRNSEFCVTCHLKGTPY